MAGSATTSLKRDRSFSVAGPFFGLAMISTGATPSIAMCVNWRTGSPPAPGLFSTTTGWPSARARGSLMTRATMSLAPPVAKVTTMRSGLSG